MAGIAAVTGVFLLIWGTVALIRAIPGWRLFAIPAALSLLWFVLYPPTMAVIATNRPPGSLGTGTPADYGLAYHDVAFRTADGVRLSAWYIPARNDAAAVLLPGSWSTRTAVHLQTAWGSVVARGIPPVLRVPPSHAMFTGSTCCGKTLAGATVQARPMAGSKPCQPVGFKGPGGFPGTGGCAPAASAAHPRSAREPLQHSAHPMSMSNCRDPQ